MICRIQRLCGSVYSPCGILIIVEEAPVNRKEYDSFCAVVGVKILLSNCIVG